MTAPTVVRTGPMSLPAILAEAAARRHSHECPDCQMLVPCTDIAAHCGRCGPPAECPCGYTFDGDAA